jgi:hypothetical protein
MTPGRIRIENIEEMRDHQGIDDEELRRAIKGLRVGDFVKVTFVPSGCNSAGETLFLRVTKIDGDRLVGKLDEEPTLPGLSGLQVGSSVAFQKVHIHSVPKRPST